MLSYERNCIYLHANVRIIAETLVICSQFRQNPNILCPRVFLIQINNVLPFCNMVQCNSLFKKLFLISFNKCGGSKIGITASPSISKLFPLHSLPFLKKIRLVSYINSLIADLLEVPWSHIVLTTCRPAFLISRIISLIILIKSGDLV
jgi:hypothetical protein